MTTPADNLRGDRILTSVVTHLCAECNALRNAYKYDASNVVSDAIKTLWAVHMQVRADVLNVPRASMTAADVPSCYPGF